MGRRLSVGPPALAALVLALLSVFAPGAPAQGAARVAAATENEVATREALAQMRAGGNAVDAAITAALVAGVASPSSSGIGGGGFALVWVAADKKVTTLDFRETAPAAVDAAALEKRPLPPTERGKLTGVPGEVAGLFELHRRHGKRAWKDVVEPAVRLAKTGYAVNAHLASVLAASEKDLRVDTGLGALFFPSGKPAAVGALIKNEKLAAALTKIAAEGAAGFYQGATAADVIAAARAHGGALTQADLDAYKPVERSAVKVSWEGHDVYTMPPPSAGGLMLAQTMRLFSKAELAKHRWNSGAYQHVLAEGMRGAIADRMRFLGDPGHEKVDVEKLIAKERMAARKKTVALDRTHAIARFGLEEHGTHHLVTADAAGNVVTLTTTVNRAFGTKLTGSASGVVLNDELDDFTKRTDVEPLGMKQSPNRPRPGARPVSSMTPTLVVKDGEVVLALGGSGGTAIATNVTQLLLGRLVFGKTPAELVRAPRFYVPTQGASILLEKGAAPSLVDDLKWRGEVVGNMAFTSTGVQMIAIDKGRKLPASDPRKHGSARAE
ncbi:MAG: gamma-glutamyltransferase [Polyangiaceae bacterium]|nr:gamma-glutamyltransferase [Polyangiaceae bacterium]